jgi:hypothetical protein
MSWDESNIPEDFINPFSDNKMRDLYKNGKFGGVRRIKFTSPD